MPQELSHGPGKYGVTGFYQQLVPGCGVLPILEISAAYAALPFGGVLVVDEQGRFKGEVVDDFGLADIEGQLVGSVMRFAKRYRNPRPETRQVVWYELTEDWEGQWNGSYWFEGAPKATHAHPAVVRLHSTPQKF